jgi:UDP-glucose 4-epimerase
MYKIIVTGGSGFIGSNLVDKLVNLGHEVVVIDDLSASENDKFYFNERTTYHKFDICDKEQIDCLFVGVDYVFHLAAESRIQPAIQNPHRAYNVNVIGTLNILDLSLKHGIKRVMYSSTSSVYGLTENLPTKEDNSTDFLNPYSHSKFLGEDIFRYYWKMHKLDSVIFRYFNVFGERSPVKGNYAPVLGIFLDQFEKQQDLTIVGMGDKRRDFIYVGDVVDVNILAMNSKNKIGATVLNVGSGKNISIKEIADLISSKQVHLDYRPGEAENTLADISKIREVLGFEPRVDVIDWIKKNLNTL